MLKIDCFLYHCAIAIICAHPTVRMSTFKLSLHMMKNLNERGFIRV